MLHLPCPRVRIYGPAFVVSTKFTMSCMVRNSSSRVCLLLGQQRQRYTSTLRALPQTVQLTRSRPWRHTPIPASVRFHGTHGHHHHGGDHGHVHADLVTTLQSSSRKGMRITWIGLVANVGLTLSKGIAGWFMNSASLLADATHSMSDLMSDFVTLYTFKMSRKPPDDIYPYGYGKFETLGSVAVSAFLLTGGAAIAYHSVDLLLATMNVSSTAQETAATTAAALTNVHGHGHAHGAILDPNAAWFALVSVIVKEWLYRATIKVGKSERSDVLIANAWHHRSDAFSSGVALIAIVGSYAGIPVLDPLGGIAVAAMIMKSGGDILLSALRELMDKGISRAEVEQVAQAVAALKENEKDLLSFHSIRGRKQGPFQHVDLVVRVDPELPMHRACRLERTIQDAVRKECPEVQQVLVSLDPNDSSSNDYRK